MTWRTRLPLTVAAAGAACLAYGVAIERTRWTLRQFDVPVLAPDAEPLRILHLSDLHMLPGQRGKQQWIRSLAALDPDFVALTGDNLSSPDAVAAVVNALQPLMDRPGALVFGSNDYYAPVPKNPFLYFKRHHERKVGGELPWRDLRDVLTACGWVDLTNHRTTITAGGRKLELSGVDDPHLKLDDYSEVAGEIDLKADAHIGLVHAPEPEVLDKFAGDGFDLLLCGHTHGGQVCVPGYGALVTNCGIDRKRVKGLHRYNGETWLHVSAGLGTSPFAPYRFACPPEASLLTLVPKPESAGLVTRARDAAAVG